MIEECVFDPQRDIRATVPDLACDLRLAVENGVVMDTGVLPEYNEIDDVYRIRQRVRDAFDAVEAHRAMMNAARQSSNVDVADPAKGGE